MLKYFFENELVSYSEKTITDWREAISESCQQLLNKGIINQTYIDEIITCVEKQGPYIVIVPQVAMPHSSDKSEGIFGTAIAFTKFKSPIVFESDDEEEKSASLFFTLAAKNSEEHMENIQNLSELLMTEGLIDQLVASESIEEYQRIMKEFNI